MFNKKLYGKVLKFKDLDNKSYEVDFKDDDLVIDIKKKLSKKINKHYKNVLFIYKNEILFDDKLISDYKVVSNQFILWFEGEDCMRYSNDDSETIKCITIIDNCNDDEYFVNMNKYSPIRMLKSIIARKCGLDAEKFHLKFNKNKLSIDNNATLEQCGLLNDGCKIDLITKKKKKRKEKKNEQKRFDLSKSIRLHDDRWMDSKYGSDSDKMECITFDVSLIPLTTGYEINVSTECDLNDLIIKICTKCRTESSLIKLYSDADKINEITNNQDLQDIYENIPDNYKIIEIYYEIVSEFDQIERIKKLGEGSFGKVYKYKNKNTNQIFALKKFKLSTESIQKDKFQIEVDCYLKLKSHPRIIKYENHFIVNNKSYILMEYMERGSLGSYVKGKDPFSEHIIAKYARQILEGLEYLHYNRILHRDLKGDNILLDENDDLKLCDFGYAKILTDLSSGDFLNGVVQSTVATLNWMSPEKFNGEPCGPASDIWSFGATMVEIVTRKYPHEGLAIGKILLNILAGKVKVDYPEGSSDDMKSFINSCLKRNPKERASIKDLYQKSFLQKNQN